MKSRTVIMAIGSSTLYNDRMLVDFVIRNLASASNFNDDSLPINFSTITWASTAMPVKGDLQITFRDFSTQNVVRVEVPVDSSFFITCVKDETGNCKVAFSSSLS
jgi:hypothetical protein